MRRAPPVIFTGSTLTRLTVGLADGTEMEFRDAATEGAVKTNARTGLPSIRTLRSFYRGKTWVSVDTLLSAATFMADNDIYDLNQGSAGVSSLTGTLYFRVSTGGFTISYPPSFFITPARRPGYRATRSIGIRHRNRNQTSFLATTLPRLERSSRSRLAIPLTVKPSYRSGTVVLHAAGGLPSGVHGHLMIKCKRTFHRAEPSAGTISITEATGLTDSAPCRAQPWPTYQSLFGGYASPGVPAGDWGVSKIVLPDGNSYFF